MEESTQKQQARSRKQASLRRIFDKSNYIIFKQSSYRGTTKIHQDGFESYFGGYVRTGLYHRIESNFK